MTLYLCYHLGLTACLRKHVRDVFLGIDAPLKSSKKEFIFILYTKMKISKLISEIKRTGLWQLDKVLSNKETNGVLSYAVIKTHVKLFKNRVSQPWLKSSFRKLSGLE